MSFNEEQRPTPLVKRQPRDRKLIMLPGLTALLHGTLDPERVVGANEKRGKSTKRDHMDYHVEKLPKTTETANFYTFLIQNGP